MLTMVYSKALILPADEDGRDNVAAAVEEL